MAQGKHQGWRAEKIRTQGSPDSDGEALTHYGQSASQHQRTYALDVRTMADETTLAYSAQAGCSRVVCGQTARDSEVNERREVLERMTMTMTMKTGKNRETTR